MSAINFSRIHCLAWSVCNLFAKLINITERNVYIIPRIFSHRLQWNNYHYVICWIICYSFAYLSIHYESYSSFLFILQQPNLIYTRDETRITTSLVPNLLNIYRNKKHRGNFSNRSDKSNEEWTEIRVIGPERVLFQAERTNSTYRLSVSHRACRFPKHGIFRLFPAH